MLVVVVAAGEIVAADQNCPFLLVAVASVAAATAFVEEAVVSSVVGFVRSYRILLLLVVVGAVQNYPCHPAAFDAEAAAVASLPAAFAAVEEAAVAFLLAEDALVAAFGWGGPASAVGVAAAAADQSLQRLLLGSAAAAAAVGTAAVVAVD